MQNAVTEGEGTVKEIRLGKSEDVDSLVVGFGIRTTPTALYVENGEIRKLLTPSGKREVDKLATVNVQSPEEKPPNDVAEGCRGIFYAGPEGWRLDLEKGKPCEEAAAGAQSLGPGGKKNLGMHLTSKDPAVEELLKRLSEKKKD